MKIKSRTIFAGIMVLLSIFLAGVPQAIAQNKQELTIVVSAWGNETLCPKTEIGKGMDYLKLIYDPLFGTNTLAKITSEYGIAEKWDMSPDGRDFTIYLRKGVKFHDGTELTSKDIEFSMDQIMSTESKYQYAGQMRASVKDVELKDPYTLIIHCKKPSAILPTLLSDSSNGGLIIPKDYYERVGQDEFIKNPIGTGPYKFHSQVIGAHIKVEAAGKHWRDGVPRYKYVTFRIIPEETSRVAMLKTGEADISIVSRNSARELMKAGFNLVSKKNAAVVQFHVNMAWTSKAFSDLRFRKALSLAIDKKAIIKHLFAGMASPAGTIPGGNIEGCGGNDLPSFPYDPEEAKRLIKEGGYEGFEFPVPSYTRAGCPEFPKVTEAVCGYWEKVGLKPKIYNTEYVVFRKKMRSQKTAGMVSGSNWAVAADCYHTLMQYYSKLHSKMKYSLVKMPKVFDPMIEKALSALNVAEMERHMREIYRVVYEQHIWVSICGINEEIATADHVPKWDPAHRRNDRNYNDIIRQR